VYLPHSEGNKVMWHATAATTACHDNDTVSNNYFNENNIEMTTTMEMTTKVMTASTATEIRQQITTRKVTKYATINPAMMVMANGDRDGNRGGDGMAKAAWGWNWPEGQKITPIGATATWTPSNFIKN